MSEKQKKILLVHDTRGLGVAAAAETKTQLELEGVQVDTYASFLETGLPANFFSSTINNLPIEAYDEVIILNIALNQKDIRDSIEKLNILGKKLQEKGKALVYLDTHGNSAEVLNLVRDTRAQCDMILRSHSLDADLLKSQSGRMLIGAISDRDSDPRVLNKLNEENEKIALGLDIASRGDFQNLRGIIISENKEDDVVQKTTQFISNLWNDEKLDSNLTKKIKIFASEYLKIKQEENSIPLPRRIQNLILETFSKDFVQRSVQEIQKENYTWFKKLAEEREPKLPELEWALPVGNVTIVPLANPNTSWTFKLLDQAVQKHQTQFGISILREAEDQRRSEEPADIITIIKNWRIPDDIRIIDLFEKNIGANWKEKLRIQEVRGREGNVTLRLDPGTLNAEKLTQIHQALSEEFKFSETKENEISAPKQTVQKLIAEKLGEDILGKARGRENNRTLRLSERDAESIDIFCTLLQTFGGTEIDKSWAKPLAEVIKIYTTMLTKASRDIREITKEYLGEKYINTTKSLSEQLTKAAIDILTDFFSELRKENSEEKIKNVSGKLAKLDQDVEITKNLIRVLPREDVGQLDLQKVKTVKIIRSPLGNLTPEQKEEVISIIGKQIKKGVFPEGDDDKFRKIIEKEEGRYEIILIQSGGNIDVFYTIYFDPKTKTHHPDWLMANPDAPIKGLAEAAILHEFNKPENRNKPYSAEVKPTVKTAYITIDKDGFIAYADTQGDPDFKDRYLRITRDKTAYQYFGKQLSGQDEEEIFELCQKTKTFYPFRDTFEIVKVTMPKDNDFVLDIMKKRTGQQVMSRFIQNPKESTTYYCIFEPTNPSHQALAKAAGEDRENHPPEPHVE